ncbi:hypothetical protein HDU99_001922 [Rhizoclosmatium hyalinum]|nr:hypothetical protein HDU99_001922 [Rhizoclosmatium hyalinum]
MLSSEGPTTSDSLQSIIKTVDEQKLKLHFQKQIQHWKGNQENPTIEDDRTEKLDVRGLLLANPKNMEAELKFHKELFSKLKFNFLEQTTKEMFLKRVLAVPTTWTSPQEIAETDQRIKNMKIHLKAFKRETEAAHETLSSLVDQVCNEHEELLKGRNRAAELLEKMGPLNAEIAEILSNFDPEKKTLSELMEMNEQLREPVQTLQTRLETLETQLSSTLSANETHLHDIAQLESAYTDLSTKIAEAKQAVQLRDPRLDGHLVWCQSWTAKLMELSGIVRVEAVNIDELVVEFSPNLVSGSGIAAVLDMQIREVVEGANKMMVEAKLANVKLDISDIVQMANNNHMSHYAGSKSSSQRSTATTSPMHVISLIVQETRTRLTTYFLRLKEKEQLETKEPCLHICWDIEAGLVEVGISSGQIVQVKLDMDYPKHYSCMQVVSVEGCDGQEVGWTVEDIQNKIELERIGTITGLIEALSG